MRSSLNLQGDKTSIHQRRKLTKRLYFIDNNLKTKLPLEATMCLNSKKKKIKKKIKKPRATRNSKAATKAYKTLI